jgi:hypothetical protein
MPSHSIGQVLDVLREHLRTHIDRLECFGRYEFQAEGWLKGEWITVLDRLRSRGQIQCLNREVEVKIKGKGSGKIDLALDLEDGRHWIELKQWFIGKQKGQQWRPVDFISELENECKKFAAVRAGDRAWVAALCTTNPGSTAWSAAIRQFNRDYAPWRLRPIDDPKDYPSSYFLGLLQVRGLDA